MAHARKKFYKAQDNDIFRASYALRQIQLLDDIERKATEQQLTEEQIYNLRQTEAVSILEALG